MKYSSTERCYSVITSTLFSITEETTETSDSNWEGNLNFIKKQITKNFKEQNGIVKRMEKDLELTIVNKIDSHSHNLTSVISNKLKTLSDKVDTIENTAELHEELYVAISNLYDSKQKKGIWNN